MKKKKNKIHIERAKREMSQEELADKVGCSKQNILNIENGKTEPKVGLAVRIAKFFGVNVEELFNL